MVNVGSLYFHGIFMKPIFGVVFGCFLALALPAQQAGYAALERRLDHWQSLLAERHWAAVADSCDRLLSGRQAPVPAALKGRAWSLKGRALRQLGRTPEALHAHRQALALRIVARGRWHEETASTYLHLGNCLLEMGRNAEAERMLQNSLRILKKIHPDGHRDLGTVYSSLAQCYWAMNQPTRAEQHLQSALSVAGQFYPPHAPEVIECTVNLASFYSERQRFDTAVALLDRVRRQQAAQPAVLPAERVPVLNVLATTRARQGRLDLAVDLWREAAALGDRDFATPLRVKGDCLHNLALGLLELGDYALAEIYLHAALHCFPDDPRARGSIFNGLGLAARYRNDLPTALRWFTEAQNAYPQAGYDNIPWPDLAGVYQNLGACYLDQNELYPAKIFLRRALAVFEQLPDAGAGRLACRVKLSECHLQQMRPDSAAWWLRQAGREVKQAPGIAAFAVYFQWGAWYQYGQNPEKALVFYRKAAEALGLDAVADGWTPYSAEAVRIDAAVSKAWQSVARKSGRADDWRQSLRYAQAAIVRYESLRSRLRGQDAGAELQGQYFRVYDLAVEALLALGEESRALMVSEAAKNNFLQQLTGRWEWQQLLAGQPELIEAERQCAYRLEYFQKRRFDLTRGRLPGQYDAPSIAALDDSIRLAETEMQQVRRSLGPPDRSGPLPEAGEMDAWQKALSPEQTVLAYHWGEERLVLFVLRRDGLKTLRIPLSDSLEAKIGRFFRLCRTEPAFGQQAADYAELVRTGRELYQILVEPAQSWLRRDVLIVPDALLWYLPFDALLTRAPDEAPHRFKRHPYLCREHTLSYSHSIAVWNALRQRKIQRPARELLAVAPDFSRNSLGLRRLQFNVQEAAFARETFDGAVWRDTQATEENFVRAAGQYRLLFLSTHGQLNDRVPDRSYVAFTQYPDSVENVLYVAELQRLSLSAELVVLSACQTASGKLYRGEGLMSISRAFQLAGAKTLVASLWDVNDAKSPLLVQAFFRYLKDGSTPAAALAGARRDYIDQAGGLEAHPYYWAGFVAVGSNEAVISVMRKTWILSACILAILGLAWMWGRKNSRKRAE